MMPGAKRKKKNEEKKEKQKKRRAMRKDNTTFASVRTIVVHLGGAAVLDAKPGQVLLAGPLAQ
jgi:hypothetical protein